MGQAGEGFERGLGRAWTRSCLAGTPATDQTRRQRGGEASSRSARLPASALRPGARGVLMRTARSLQVDLGSSDLTGPDWIGWVSSALLLLTLGHQVRKQWLSGDSRGVSTWLFAGQLLASVGFSLYSFLLENWVFLVTNLLLVVNALLGQWVTLRNRRRGESSRGGGAGLPADVAVGRGIRSTRAS